MGGLDIDTLREFVVLGKSLSFTKAAHDTHLDQSTLSRHLQALERELGLELMSRSTRAVKLTKAGESFLGEMIDILRRYDGAVGSARELGSLDAPSLVLGGVLMRSGIVSLATCAMALARKEGMPVSVKLFEPHTSPFLTTLAANDPIDCLRKGSIDMALIFGCEEGDWSGLERRPLFHDDYVLFVDERHPLAGKGGPLRLIDLAPHVLRRAAFYERNSRRVEESCQISGFVPKTITKVVDSASDWCVSEGPTDAFVFNSSAVDVVPPTALSGLTMLAFDDPDAYFEAQAVWRSGDDNPAITTFLEALTRSCALLGLDDAV